jgi:NAD(P)-dependent dehydrogenase (short-subunit alcohol dehydrogenase family)
MLFKDKIVIVTGAAAGIGKATAVAFAAEGAKLVLGDIVKEKLDATVAELKASGAEAVGLVGNIADVNDANALVDLAKSHFGRLDVLVNNAGIMDRFLPVGEVTDEVWSRVLAVNLNGPMFTMRRAIPIMIEQGGGVIVTVASAAGLGGGFAGAAYTASKHGVIGLIKNTAVMYHKKGIRSVGIAPGAVNTGIPLGGAPSEYGYSVLGPGMAGIPRVGEPYELANAIVMLASDKASFVNGTVLPVDGSWLAGG